MNRYPLTVFYDGACPICAREIALVKRLDRHRRLTLCVFSSAEYEGASVGLSIENLSKVIHARCADGTIMTGVEVFRAMWEAVGLGGLVWLSRLSFLEPVLQKGYAWFANNRF